MTRDLGKTKVIDLIKDENLLNYIMSRRPSLSQKEAREQIIISWDICNSYATPEPVPTSDHQPCGECGGTFFLRTGTCHVCQTCGQSQGCS